MGLLDELRKKTDQQLQAEEQANASEADEKICYEQTLKPLINRAHRYLQELSQHLNVVKEAYQANYVLTPEGLRLSGPQSDYVVKLDDDKEPRKLELSFKVTFPDESSFQISGNEAITHCKQLLDKLQCEYHRTDKPSDNSVDGSTQFTVIGPIHARVVIMVDPAKNAVIVALRNFDEAVLSKITLKPEEFDDSYLDRLGRVIIRRVHGLKPSEISEEAREQLRQRLAAKRAEELRRSQELALQQQRQNAEAEANKPSAKISRNLFSVKDKIGSELRNFLNKHNKDKSV